jgi:hypothetical protein
MYCIIKDTQIIQGSTLNEIAGRAGFYFDFHNRTLVLPGGRGIDTVIYDKNQDDEWFIREASRRAVDILQREGWQLYTKQERT